MHPLKKVPAGLGCHIRPPLSVPRTRQGSNPVPSGSPVGQTLRQRLEAWARSIGARLMRAGI